jgi:pimeloyl-ACP methyl ester carboxylesterase
VPANKAGGTWAVSTADDAMKDEVSATGMSFDDVGDGPAVVLLHAFPLARAMWRPQVTALQGDYRVIAPDLRGFGGSRAFTAAPSVETMADDVAALLEELKVPGPVVLGGLSMGGYVALAFARRHPARLRGLVLADTKADPDDDAGRANRDRLIAFAGNNPARAVIDQMLPKLLGPDTAARRPEVVEEVRAVASHQAPAGIVGALKALRDRPDANPGLGDIAVPTLVIVGRDDTLTPPAKSEEMAARIRDARLVVLDGAGHLANLEQPDNFNAALRSFLQSVA